MAHDAFALCALRWADSNVSQLMLSDFFLFAGFYFCRAAFRPLIARGKRFSGLKAALRMAEMA